MELHVFVVSVENVAVNEEEATHYLRSHIRILRHEVLYLREVVRDSHTKIQSNMVCVINRIHLVIGVTAIKTNKVIHIHHVDCQVDEGGQILLATLQ